MRSFGEKGGLPHTLISLLMSAAVTLLCLFAFAFVMTKFDVSGGIVSSAAGIALCLGAYFFSYFITKKRRKHGLLTGLACGTAVFALAFLLGLIFVRSPITSQLFVKLAALAVCGGIGGIIGVNSRISY